MPEIPEKAFIAGTYLSGSIQSKTGKAGKVVCARIYRMRTRCSDLKVGNLLILQESSRYQRGWKWTVQR
jgi:hypothetical protein